VIRFVKLSTSGALIKFTLFFYKPFAPLEQPVNFFNLS